MIRDMYATGQRIRVRDDRSDFRFVMDHLQIGPVFISDMAMSMAITLEVFNGLGLPAVMSSATSNVQVATGRDRFVPAVQGSVIFRPNQPYAVHWAGGREAIGFDGEAAQNQAVEHLDPGQRLGFDFPRLSPRRLPPNGATPPTSSVEPP